MSQIITGYCSIYEGKVILNDELIFYQENFTNFADFIKGLYKQEKINYPKFYKMDNLCKLGFLTAELLLMKQSLSLYAGEDVGIVLGNSSASLDTDLTHQETICDRSAYFPSPSVFVYTLPNIMTGEICIRHRIKGENMFLVSETFKSDVLYDIIAGMFQDNRCQAVIGGWVELLKQNYNSTLFLIEGKPEQNSGETQSRHLGEFSPDRMDQIYKRI